MITNKLVERFQILSLIETRAVSISCQYKTVDRKSLKSQTTSSCLLAAVRKFQILKVFSSIHCWISRRTESYATAPTKIFSLEIFARSWSMNKRYEWTYKFPIYKTQLSSHFSLLSSLLSRSSSRANLLCHELTFHFFSFAFFSVCVCFCTIDKRVATPDFF